MVTLIIISIIQTFVSIRAESEVQFFTIVEMMYFQIVNIPLNNGDRTLNKNLYMLKQYTAQNLPTEFQVRLGMSKVFGGC